MAISPTSTAVLVTVFGAFLIIGRRLRAGVSHVAEACARSVRTFGGSVAPLPPRPRATCGPARPRRSPRLAAPWQLRTAIDPFEFPGLAVVGDGSASFARRLVLDALTRYDEQVEVVISRTDATDLFGLASSDLPMETIPGLILTEELAQTRRYLASPGPRRLLITCSGGIDLFHDLTIDRQHKLAVVSLSPWMYDTLEITTDGHIVKATGPKLPALLADTVPLLSRPQAAEELAKLPKTSARSRALPRHIGDAPPVGSAPGPAEEEHDDVPGRIYLTRRLGTPAGQPD